MSRSAWAALDWLRPNGEATPLATGGPRRSALHGLRRRGLAEPLDPAGLTWRRTPAGEKAQEHPNLDTLAPRIWA